MVGNVLVALVLLSGEIDLRASAVVESRAGETPILAGTNPTGFVAEIVAPAAMFVYSDPGLTFHAAYSPRVYWQHPNAVNSWAPLLLHTADLLLEERSTRRLSLIAGLTGAIGEPDYTQLQTLVGGVGQSALPQITEIASVSGQLLARVTLTRRWELDLDGQALYWRSFGAAPVVTTPTTTLITEQRSAGEQVTALYRLTPRHALGFGAAGSEASFSNGLQIYTVGPTVTWKVRLTPVDELKLTLGFTYVRAAGTLSPDTIPPLGPSGQTATPVGAFDLISRIARRDEFFLLANANGGVDYFVDPVLGTTAPRARAGLGLTAIMAPDWMAIVRGDFSTALRSTPLAQISPGYYPDETLVSLTASVRRVVTPSVFAEIGGLWAERAPAFVTPDFQFRERQLWVFARLAWTSHPLPRLVN